MQGTGALCLWQLQTRHDNRNNNNYVPHNNHKQIPVSRDGCNAMPWRVGHIFNAGRLGHITQVEAKTFWARSVYGPCDACNLAAMLTASAGMAYSIRRTHIFSSLTTIKRKAPTLWS